MVLFFIYFYGIINTHGHDNKPHKFYENLLKITDIGSTTNPK